MNENFLECIISFYIIGEFFMIMYFFDFLFIKFNINI